MENSKKEEQLTATEVLKRRQEWANSPEAQEAVKEFEEQVIAPLFDPLVEKLLRMIREKK